MHIIALTTCHNRRQETLACLHDLHSQELPVNTSLEVVLVDDNSTDGTSHAVKECFPNVEIIPGTGSLFWAGGMRHGWVNGLKNKQFDALLVFNDDIRLKNDAIKNLVEVMTAVQSPKQPKHIVSGAFTDFEGKTTTYGGFQKASLVHPLRVRMVQPTGELQKIYTLNMNLALIAREVIDEIGFLASYFTHGGADVEYGIRLIKAGGSVWLTPNHLGYCERNSSQGTSFEPGISKTEQLRRLTSIKEEPYLERARYLKAHAGLLWPLFWPIPYLKVIFSPSQKNKH